MTTPRAKKSKQSRKPVERGRTASDVQSEDRRAKLGTKYVCYSVSYTHLTLPTKA